MSIPDNPFTNDLREQTTSSSTPARTTSPPILQVDAASSIRSASPPSRPTGASLLLRPDGSRRGESQAMVSGGGGSGSGSGGAATGGVPKTPRRVQWTSDSHIVEVHPIERAELSPVEVDVLDQNNIGQVNAALERHRSRSSATGSAGARRTRGMSDLSAMTTSTHDTAGDVDDGEEDYDYRLDVDPPRRSGTTATGASGRDLAPPKFGQATSGDSAARDRRPEEQDEGTSLQQYLDTGINEHLDGQFIPYGETDGLPDLNRQESRREVDAATDLVRAHTGRWGVLRRRVRGAGAANRAFHRPGHNASTTGEGGAPPAAGGGDADAEKAAEHRRRGSVRDAEKATAAQEAFARRYADPEDMPIGRRPSAAAMGMGMGGMGMGGMGMGMGGMGGGRGGMNGSLPQGASVLSSLLALYGQPGGSGGASGTTSAASSRPSSIRTESDDEPSDHEQDHPHDHDDRHQPSSRPSSWLGRHTPGRAHAHGRATDTQDSSPADQGHQGGDHGASRTEHKYRQGVEHSGPAWLDKFRPKAARSGAGVFGALIQNTQATAAGVATPQNSTLAPRADRPGYTLSRYSLPLTDEGRSRSRQSSRQDSSRPGSVHSSTAVSNNGDGDSPRVGPGSAGRDALKKNLSSDDVYAMRSAAGLGGGGKTASIGAESQPGSPAGSTFNADFAKKRNRSGLKLDSLGQLARQPQAVLRSGGQAIRESGQALRNAERWIMSGGRTPLTTPPADKTPGGGTDGYFPRVLTEDERRRKEWEAEKRKRKKAKEARKKQEIFIIQHVAAILSRQQFIMKLARALMMFGSPSHRLETQIQATARVLEINAQVIYLPGIMLISFGDDATHTSETKFLKQATGLDLGKLLATHRLYWKVVHDRISVDEASKDLDALMTSPVYYTWWQSLIIGACCSVFIVVIGFSGSFADALVSAPLGMLLVAVQMLAARNDMFSNVFEIAIATVISFLAAALASTQYFCYTALVSGGVVLILPGYIVLSGALELASRNITAGAVRIGYSVIYSLFLGFGISIGAELYIKITGLPVIGSNDNSCYSSHLGKPWWGVTPSAYWYFLCCPAYSFFLSLRNQQPLFNRELPVMVLIACAGWASNHFSAEAFPNRSDMTSAIGSFVVGTLGNLWGRLSKGSSFPVTVVGILFQLPSGLANGGIFNFASESTSGSNTAYSSGFSVAQQLISVAIGLTVGLFVSAVVTHPFGGGRRRGSGIFSF